MNNEPGQPAPGTPAATGPGPLPARLSALRAARSLSLRELAARSGVSAGMISEVERGTKSPTVRLAYQLARALGCSLSELLEGPAPFASKGASGGTPAAAVVTPGPRTLLDDPASGLRREGHGHPLLHGRLEVAVYTLQPGARSGLLDPNRPGTLETLVVLDGQLELSLDGHPLRLEAGASAGHGVHATEYANPGPEPCRFLVLVDTSRC